MNAVAPLLLAVLGGVFGSAASSTAETVRTDRVVGRDAPSVQGCVDLAQPGDRIVLPEGEWPGPVVVDRAVVLHSNGGVLIGHTGTTLRITAAGARVEGLVVRGSGTDLQGPDACVRVETTATATVIVDSTFTDCLFGIWTHEVHGARIEGNRIDGRPANHPSKKGNGIHLFDSEDLVVRGNQVRGARDGIYVSATNHSVIADNLVSHQRYGIHYMYSWHNVISGNVANHNSGGIALMQSRHLEVRGNDAMSNDKQGILFRDTQYSTITHNTVKDNGEGLFFFSSLDNEIAYNQIVANQIGARVWAGTERNRIHDNAFVGNANQVFYVSSSDQEWGSNYWSDYLGWDQDSDGHGDRPYRNDVFLAQLLHRFPAAVLLLNSPTLEILNQLQSYLPQLRVPTVIDAQPLMQRPSISVDEPTP